MGQIGDFVGVTIFCCHFRPAIDNDRLPLRLSELLRRNWGSNKYRTECQLKGNLSYVSCPNFWT